MTRRTALVGVAVAVLAVLAGPAPAQDKDLAWAVAQAPADAAVVAAVRGLADLEAALKALVGPDAQDLSIVAPLEAELPPGVLDAAGPAVLIVCGGANGLAPVAMLRLRDEAKLAGEPVEGGLLRVTYRRPLPPGAPAEAQTPERTVYVLKMAPWALVSDKADSVRAVSGAAARLALTDAQRAAVAGHTTWANLNLKALGAAARAALDQVQKQQAAAGAPAVPAATLKMLDSLLGLADQAGAVTLTADVTPAGVAVRGEVALAEGSSLLALAAAGRPVDNRRIVLPAAERLIAAAWGRLDGSAAAAPMQTLFRPVLDALSEGEDEATRKNIDELWKSYAEWAKVLGGDGALAFESAPPGQGLYRLVETFAVTDPAAYRQLMTKYMTTSKDIMKVVMSKMAGMPGMPGAPPVKVDIDYREAAETVEGVPVDVMRLKIAMDLPPDAPPAARDQVKSMMDAIYGPEGMTIRMALVDRLAVVAVGDAGTLARGIRVARGQGTLLAADPRVAAALGRLPAGGSAAGLLSPAEYMYMAMGMMDRIMAESAPPEVREAAKAEGLQPLAPPPPTDFATFSGRLDGRTLRLTVDVPQSAIRAAVRTVHEGTARMEWYMRKQQEHAAKQAPPAPKP